MVASKIRPMSPDDWLPTPIETRWYCNQTPLTGFVRRDGQGGSVLHPVVDDHVFEPNLLRTHEGVQAAYPGVCISRHIFQMPHWLGPELPTEHDYPLVDSTQRLTTTSVTVILLPQDQIRHASLGFHYQNHKLPTLRERLSRSQFQGLVGNLGYFMTRDLINDKHLWSHKTRFPDFPLPDIPAYIGFHSFRDEFTGRIHSGIQGAHPATIGIRQDGTIDILPDLNIDGYTIEIAAQKVLVQSINDPQSNDKTVMLFTPALRTPEVNDHIAVAQASTGTADYWKSFAPYIPVEDSDNRVNLFIASEGDGQRPIEKVVALWEGRAPLPSFGAVLSFKRDYFLSLFGDVRAFRQHHLNEPVHIIPHGATNFDIYDQMLGGLVPAVISGKHIYHVESVTDLMGNLIQFGNACSPIAEAGKESRNFDPFVREPAGILVQTDNHIGWVLFDGRHELSIGASIADAAILLKKLETHGKLKGESIRQAVFVDGGSAMKVYAADSDGPVAKLDLLNRVAAGSRNKAGLDPDGLNLYSTLSLALDSEHCKRIT